MIEFKPFEERVIDAIMKTHPELSREYIITQHKEIYDSISDEEVHDFLEKLIESEDQNDAEWYVDWNFDEAKKLLISMKEGESHLTMDWEYVKKDIRERISKYKQSDEE